MSKRARFSSYTLVTFGLLLVLLVAGCTPYQPVQPLSAGKAIVALSFLQSQNANLDRDYAASWDSTRQAWVAGSLPWQADLSNLCATFSLSAGATALVGGLEQTSGSSRVDFSHGALYTIQAEDGTSQTVTVLVNQALRPPAEGPLGVSITVASYNAEDFYAGGVLRQAAIATMLKNASVEVVVLTETSSTLDTQNSPDNASDIDRLQSALAAIGWAMPYAASVDTGSGSDPTFMDDIVVLSKYPITSYQVITSPGSWPRAGLAATVRISNDSGDYVDVLVLGFHLKASSGTDDDTVNVNKRIAQAQAMASYLRNTYTTSLSSMYCIVAGDMNTWKPGDRSPAATCTLGYLRLLDNADSADNFIGLNEEYLPTTSTHQLGSVLDHIIVSPAMAGVYRGGSIAVRTSDTDVNVSALSDHYPVLAEFDL